MKIYVGLWSLLPEDWEGINGLYEKSEYEIKQEIGRQMDSCYDDNVGSYTPIEFEETFNGDNEGNFNGTIYFIKIF